MADNGLSSTPHMEPRRLEYVSPSNLGALEQCLLQVAFSTDPRYRKQVFQGPKARLGSACHALLDRISKGELAGVPEPAWRTKLEEIWKDEASKQENSALNSPLERHLGPVRRWPGYAIRRARVLRRASEILRRKQHAGGRTASVRTERRYRSYGGKLRGRADAVYSSGSRTVIEDYKTGNIHEEQPGHGVTLKESYRRQILLYAAMHHYETGTWPEAGYVVPLVGEREEVRIDPVEARQEAENAVQLLERYNAQLLEASSYWELASPSQEACRFCDYKAFCKPFWENSSPTWDWPRTAAVEGQL